LSLLESDQILQEDILYQYKKESEEMRLLTDKQYNYEEILRSIEEQARQFKNAGGTT
jgi:hypothetical protein